MRVNKGVAGTLTCHVQQAHLFQNNVAHHPRALSCAHDNASLRRVHPVPLSACINRTQRLVFVRTAGSAQLIKRSQDKRGSSAAAQPLSPSPARFISRGFGFVRKCGTIKFHRSRQAVRPDSPLFALSRPSAPCTAELGLARGAQQYMTCYSRRDRQEG